MSSATDQTIQIIPLSALLEQTARLRREGYRLVQIGATRLPEQIELTYSFDRENRLANLRLQLPGEARVPSISSIYWCAFLYENEMHDLFNVQVDGMAVDFHGHLYETSVKFPFGSTKAPAAKPAVTTSASASTVPQPASTAAAPTQPLTGHPTPPVNQ
jgi:ech hydrogenase subunit D